MHNESINKIKEIAYPIVEQGDTYLVDVEIKHQKIPEVWVLVDSESNTVSLDTYSGLSKKIGDALDAEDIFLNQYRLNVSSPGLSRPLSDKRQYVKNKGRMAKVKFKNGSQYEKLEGVINQVDDHRISLESDKYGVKNILFDNIVETKIVPKI